MPIISPDSVIEYNILGIAMHYLKDIWIQLVLLSLTFTITYACAQKPLLVLPTIDKYTV